MGLTIETPAGEVPRPGTGIVAGDGTADDPFLISGWRVDQLELRNTDDHVVIRDMQIGVGVTDRQPEARGLEIRNAANVSLVSNEVADAFDFGSYAVGSPGICIEDNRFVNDATVEVREPGQDTTLEDEHVPTLTVLDSPAARVLSNTFETRELSSFPQHSLLLAESPRSLVADNEGDQIEIHANGHSTIVGNDLEQGLRIELGENPSPHAAHLRVERNDLDSQGVATLTEDGAQIDRGASTVLVAHAEGVQVEEMELKSLISSDAAELSLDEVVVDDLEVSHSPGLDVDEGGAGVVSVHQSPDSRISGVMIRSGSGFEFGNFLGVTESPRTTLEDLEMGSSERPSDLEIEDSPGTILRSSELRVSSLSVDSTDVRITRNWLNDTEIRAEDAGSMRIQGNVIRGTILRGGTAIVNNTIEDSKLQTRADRIESNVIDTSFADIQLLEGDYTTEVHQNNLESGLEAEEGVQANAENNWWGCPDGPTADACSDAVGNVDFDPWLTEPNPDAGSPLTN